MASPPRLHPLVHAVRKGNLDAVQNRMQKPVPPGAVYDALVAAALNGHTDIVALLAPQTDPTHEDALALRLAAMRGHAETVRVLLPLSGPNATSSDGLNLAAQNGHLDVVRAFLDQNPARTMTSTEREALSGAARRGQTAVVRALMERREPHHTGEKMALYAAVSQGHTEVVKAFLQNPAYLPADPTGALREAARTRHPAVVALLLPCCRPGAVDRAFTGLIEQAQHEGADLLAEWVSRAGLSRLTEQELAWLPRTKARLEAVRLESDLPGGGRVAGRARM